MFTRKHLTQIAFLLVAAASAQVAQAQSSTQSIDKKGSLVGATFQGSDEPVNVQPGWEHTEGVPTPKTKSNVSLYVVDHYEKGQEHLFLLLQKTSAKAAKLVTWKILDTLYVKPLVKGQFVEFCATCKNGPKLSSETFISLVNKLTKQDKQNGYQDVAQMWLADRAAGKFMAATGVKSYLEGGKK
ncbi:MAG: hypothetical protein ACRYFX_14460 [Janthinobacterium lividum]